MLCTSKHIMSAAVKRLISPTKSGAKPTGKSKGKGWSLRSSRSPAKADQAEALAPQSVHSLGGEDNALDLMNGLDSSLMDFEPVKQVGALRPRCPHIRCFGGAMHAFVEQLRDKYHFADAWRDERPSPTHTCIHQRIHPPHVLPWCLFAWRKA